MPSRQDNRLAPLDQSSWQYRWYKVVFHSDTPGGQFFDVGLLITIVVSVLVVMLETVNFVERDYGQALTVTEWVVTAIFSLEYLVRLLIVRKAWHYALSFYGLIDILSVLPSYLSILVPGTHLLVTIRILRLLRVFRVLKLTRFLGEGQVLAMAIRASMPKITVFLGAVMTSSTVLGTVMYIVEGPENGFSSIPKSIYWAVVTLTTVGYGDIAPQTIVGQFIATFIMILGYGIIAVPTGIVSVELNKSESQQKQGESCENCGASGHRNKAAYCYKCGYPISLSK